MAKSPGHQKHPGHRIESTPLERSLSVTASGEPIALSDRVLKVEETGSPVRYYFPREDVKMDKLQPSDTTSYCPFKGTARYFNIVVSDRVLRDAVWSYEQPYDEHPDLREKLAFYDDKIPELTVR